MTKKVKFTNTNKSTFYATLRKRVDSYFEDQNLSVHANGAMWFKAFFFLGGFIALYLLILLGNFNALTMVCLAILLGMFGAFVGFNICHDAIHKAFSDKPFINKIFSILFSLVGASAYVWSICHNIVHHTYTNIAGHDEDIDVAPGLIRFCENEPVNKIQRYQHFYAFGLYSLAMLSWVFRKDYKKFFQTKIGCQVANHPRIEYFNLFFFKFVYYFLFIIGFLALQFSQGLVLGLVFQLAHVVEGTSFPHPNEDGNIEEAWAAHQMMTTANFAVNSKLAGFLCGGLNRQVEHHLFPKICHIHYPAIGKIVKDTALEFNLPYIESPTFMDALGSHYRMLRKLGKEAYEEKALISSPCILAPKINISQPL